MWGMGTLPGWWSGVRELRLKIKEMMHLCMCVMSFLPYRYGEQVTHWSKEWTFILTVCPPLHLKEITRATSGTIMHSVCQLVFLWLWYICSCVPRFLLGFLQYTVQYVTKCGEEPRNKASTVMLHRFLCSMYCQTLWVLTLSQKKDHNN